MPLDLSKVIVTFSRKYGVQTWHFEEPDCDKCGYMKRCAERLLSKLAHVIFTRLIPELRS
jgi:hypothetical protein